MILKDNQRWLVYGVGFALGCGLVALLAALREPPEERERGGLAREFLKSMVGQSGIKPLPEGSPQYLRRTRLLGFESFALEDGERRIWLLELIDHPEMPSVRVTERLTAEGESLEYAIMAADRLLARPAEGVATGVFANELGELGLRDVETWASGWHVVEIGSATMLALDQALDKLDPESQPWLAEAKPFPILLH